MHFMKRFTAKHRNQTPSSKEPQNQTSINSQTPNSMTMMLKPVQDKMIHKSSLDELDTSISPAVIQKLRRYSQNNSSEDRIEWLQSQVIGNQMEFDTPFGQRTLTYADHTASGRSLKFIEDYIIDKVLPSYGNHSTYKLIHQIIIIYQRLILKLFIQETHILMIVLWGRGQPSWHTRHQSSSRSVWVEEMMIL